jgi:uncharacterized protein YdaU (DUF1376 family)
MADRKSYIPFDFPAFMQDTIHLSDKQKILYMEMIWYQFDREVGFKDATHVCLLLGKTKANAPSIKLILDQFFTEFEDESNQTQDKLSPNLWQKRVKLEIDKRRQKQDEGRIHASKRVYKKDGSPNAGKVSIDKVSIGKEDTNVSSNAGARETSTADLNFNDLQVEHGEAISEFWKAFPNGHSIHNGTKAFLRLICAGVDAEAIIKGAVCLSEWVKAETTARGKQPLVRNAPRWLDERGWEDELVMPEPPKGLGYTNDKWATAETGYL